MSSENRIRSKKRKLGDVVRIRLDETHWTFGRVLEEPLFAFYDLLATSSPPLNTIIGSPILFKIWVMNSAVKTGRWEVIGNAPLEDNLLQSPRFFKVDPITKKVFIYWNGHETPAGSADVDCLECAAVWSAEHVEDRLRDHFAGQPNKWVESLRAQLR